MHPYISVLKLPLLDGRHHKVGDIVRSITSCLTITILECALNYCIEKTWLW
jgi:hypothetical protein